MAHTLAKQNLTRLFYSSMKYLLVQHLLARHISAVKNRVQIINLQQKFKTFNCFQQKQQSKCSITDRIHINIPAGFP